jgi:restriction endonuclease S subunit
MKTTWVKLSDVCETTSGGTPSRSVADYYGGDIPWVKSGELLDDLITDTEEKITKAGLASSSAKLFPAGTLLIALYGATVGRLGILGIDSATNQAVCGITPNEQLDRDFLFYYLLKQREKLIDSRTGGAQPNISQEIIRELDIPLPPLTKQKRIASLLARADRLRQLRRTAHDLSASVLQSVFLEMFGDDKYDLMEFREAIKIDRTAASENDGKTLPYVGLEDIEKDKGDFTKDYQPIVQNMLATNYKFTPKHVLYGKLRPYLNKVAMPSFAGVCTTEILPLLPASGKVNKAYLWAYLRSKKFVDWASNNVAGANLPRLSPELLGDYPFPVPPLSKQEEFAGVVARVESLRGRMGESERQAQNLFESLLAQSFGG